MFRGPLIVFAALLAVSAAVGCSAPSPAPKATASPATAGAAGSAGGRAAAALSSQISPSEVSFRIGHTGTPTSLLEQDAQAYVKMIEQATAGKAKGQSFPDSQLGKQQELVDAVQSGALEMIVASSEFVSVVPEFGVFDLPFAFADRAAVKRAVEGPLGDELAKAAEKKGLVVLGFWENGYRQITNSKRPVRSPADLQGLKMRTPPNQDRVKMFSLWGADPAPLDFSELFGALKAGTFDGQENPIAQITSAKLFDVQKHLSFTGHVYTPTYLVVNKAWWGRLAPEMQKVLRESAVANGDASRKRGEEVDAKGEATVKAAGVEVLHDVDKAAFRQTAASLYDDYQAKFGPKLVELLKSA